jgi:hypothetical protein
MNTEISVKGMVARFKEILDAHDKQLECFCRLGVQLEGWLKGELLYFLDNEKNEKKIVNFDREVQLNTGRQKVDLRLEILTETTTLNVWIELKHWLIGSQKGTKYNAPFYFGDASSVGIKLDVEKLGKITDGSKYLLILTTANPGVDDWSKGIAKFNDKFSPLCLNSLTKPTDFPQSYFLGLLEVHT